MDRYRRTVAVAGVLFGIGTVAGLVSVSLTDPVLSAPNVLASVAAAESTVYFGALLELAMGLALVGMSVLLYPVLAGFDVRAAVGYFGARLVEFVIYIVGVISLLSLVTLGRDYAAAGAPAQAHYQTMVQVALEAREWGGHVILDVAVFPLGALLFYYVLHGARLVPRWLSTWGLAGAALYWAAAPLVLFGALEPFSSAHIALQAPLGIQEIVLALWMIFRGFDTRSITWSDRDAV